MAARYDYLNLNHKNVFGGTQHNLTLGLNWYYNDNLRFSVFYVRAGIHPRIVPLTARNASEAVKRHLDIVGMRVQIRFK